MKAIKLPQVSITIDAYSHDRNARTLGFKSQKVDKSMFLEHKNIALIPFVQQWPLIIASTTPIERQDELVTLNLPTDISYRIGNAKGDVEATVSLEIDTLEWLIHVVESDGSEWIHREDGTREYTGFGDFGVRDNETGELVIDIQAEVKEAGDGKEV